MEGNTWEVNNTIVENHSGEWSLRWWDDGSFDKLTYWTIDATITCRIFGEPHYEVGVELHDYCRLKWYTVGGLF